MVLSLLCVNVTVQAVVWTNKLDMYAQQVLGGKTKVERMYRMTFSFAGITQYLKPEEQVLVKKYLDNLSRECDCAVPEETTRWFCAIDSHSLRTAGFIMFNRMRQQEDLAKIAQKAS